MKSHSKLRGRANVYWLLATPGYQGHLLVTLHFFPSDCTPPVCAAWLRRPGCAVELSCVSNSDQGFSLLCHDSFAVLAYPVITASGPEGKIRQITKDIFSCRVSPRPSPCMGWLHPEPHGKSKLIWGTPAAGGTDSLSSPKAALCWGCSASPLFSRHTGFASCPPHPHYVPLVIQRVLGLVCPAFLHIPKSMDHEVRVFYIQLRH